MSRRNRPLRQALLALAFPVLCGAQPAAGQPADPHEAAIALARAGDHERALAALERLAVERPDDRRIAFDRIAVLGWAGRDAQALASAAATDLARAPAYVLEAIGRSARNLKRFDLALAAYRRSASAHPDRAESLIGVALTLSDLGRHAQAASLLDDALAASVRDAPRDGARQASLLTARASVAESAEEWLAALSLHQQALDRDPQQRDALLGVTRTASRIGAPQIAAALAARHPGLLSPAEAAATGDEAAALAIRWGQIQERIESGSARFAWLDNALRHSEPAAARLAAALERDPDSAAAGLDPATRRLLADRIVALEARRRPGDAIALYRSMRTAGAPVPGYALRATADAMLATRQPREALPLYREALESRPGHFNTALGLFYALIESERFDEALAHIDELAERTPRWRAFGRPNPDLVTARVAQALARLYSDRPEEAEVRLRTLVDEFPYNAGVREAFATMTLLRGWPRLADEEYRRAIAVEPQSVGLRAERIAPLLAAHAWTDAEAQLGAPVSGNPEDHRVVRARDLWTVHNLRELTMTAGFGRSGDAAPAASNDWRLDARLYTQPLDYRWRIFALTSLARAEFDAGYARWHRAGIGAEYRGRDIRLEAAVTGGSSNRTGIEASGAWRVGDHWSFDLAGSSVSSNVPMQAWLAGVRADEAAASVRYTWHESRSLGLGLTRMGFTDGNERVGYWGSWFERWVSNPRWRIESTAWLGASSNSLAAAPYFNPGSDFTATVELAGEWLTWRLYERSLRQRLAATLGHYGQEGFGSGSVAGLVYEHIWDLDRRLYLRYGIGRLLRPYDGERSGRSFGSVTLDWRF